MFIAEIGLNHKGSEARAWAFLKQLTATKAEAITFQIPKPEFYERVKDWGGPLQPEFYPQAIDFAHQHNKQIGFAVGDKDLIPFLNQKGADFWKLLSIYNQDPDLQTEMQNSGRLVFVSTGVSDEEEILILSKLFENIKLIHTQLSHDLEDTNLKAIGRLKDLTGKEIAFGLHCSDQDVLYLSVAFAPSDIFFYVKENAQEKYPDDQHAILIADVNKVIDKMNYLEQALGSGIKKKMASRIHQDITLRRRSINGFKIKR